MFNVTIEIKTKVSTGPMAGTLSNDSVFDDFGSLMFTLPKEAVDRATAKEAEYGTVVYEDGAIKITL